MKHTLEENEKGTNQFLGDLSLSAGYGGQVSNFIIEDLKAIVDFICGYDL